jgi:hypothetical protein
LPVFFSAVDHKVFEFATAIAFAFAFEMVNVCTPFTVYKRMTFTVD